MSILLSSPACDHTLNYFLLIVAENPQNDYISKQGGRTKNRKQVYKTEIFLKQLTPSNEFFPLIFTGLHNLQGEFQLESYSEWKLRGRKIISYLVESTTR